MLSAASLVAAAALCAATAHAALDASTFGVSARRPVAHGSATRASLGQALGRRRLMDSGADDDVSVAPASIGSDVPLSYFGPAPSDVQRELIGPFQLLKSGTVDEAAGTVTIPIYKGIIDSKAAPPPAPNGKAADAPADPASGPTTSPAPSSPESSPSPSPSPTPSPTPSPSSSDNAPSEDSASASGGKEVFYVVTDTTDTANAAALGLNHSPKLRYANVGRAARQGYLDNNLIVHWAAGDVDFTPEHRVTPGGPSPFPPSAAQPGGVGDDSYSPLLYLRNAGAHVYNAPIVSSGAPLDLLRTYCDGIPEDQEEQARKYVHDKVVSICPDESGIGGTVTLSLTPGWSFARPVLYLSMDASDATAAAIEEVNYAPALADIKVGGDDTLFSAVERIFIFANGLTNEDIGDGNATVSVHPLRQGLNSALMGEGAALSVLGGIPTIATDYSPLWDANIGEWTDEAIDRNFRTRLTEEFAILGMAELGLLTGPDGAPYGSVGFVVNCPIVQRLL